MSLEMPSQLPTALKMPRKISLEAWPVKTFFNASEVRGKWGPPVMNSPKRKKKIIRLQNTERWLSRNHRKYGKWLTLNQMLGIHNVFDEKILYSTCSTPLFISAFRLVRSIRIKSFCCQDTQRMRYAIPCQEVMLIYAGLCKFLLWFFDGVE